MTNRSLILIAVIASIVFSSMTSARAPNSGATTTISTPTLPTATASFIDPVTGMEFIPVKGGCFQMGDTFGEGGDDERPVHEVCVRDYFIGRFEVTQEQWQKVMGSNPAKHQLCDACPVESVSWNDIQEFIGKLNAGTGKSYRLPTEAEWEYAARSGGKNEKYAGGNDLDDLAWYASNADRQTHPVGQKRPNGLGIHDMSGNVWEWCQDWYTEDYYRSSPKNDPQGPPFGHIHTLRGGSCVYIATLARTSARIGYSLNARKDNYGFRLVLTR